MMWYLISRQYTLPVEVDRTIDEMRKIAMKRRKRETTTNTPQQHQETHHPTTNAKGTKHQQTDTQVIAVTLALPDHGEPNKDTEAQGENLDFVGWSYKNYDQNVLCDKLLNLDWNDFYQCEDVNRAWNIMLSYIMDCINVLCPLKKYGVAQAKKPWITKEILEMIKDKDRLLQRAKNTNNQQDWELARTARNNTSFQIRRAKANFIQDNLN